MAITRHKTLPAKHPGVVFKERYLDRKSISVKEAAASMGVDLGELHSFVGGNIELTMEFCDRLESFTGVSKAFWLKQLDKYQSSNKLI